jgi:hypothetical protein
MRKLTAFPAICLLFLSAGYVASAGEDVELKLKGPRSVFMRPTGMYSWAPVNVRVRAELEGTPENTEEYYCLEEEWEWGDETESTYEPDCDPYEEGAELKRIYSATHTFRYPGTYTIWLRLKNNRDTVIAGRTTVRVRGS